MPKARAVAMTTALAFGMTTALAPKARELNETCTGFGADLSSRRCNLSEEERPVPERLVP
jgi:hypothetical protein